MLFGKIRAHCPACGYIHFVDPKVAVGVLIEQEGKFLLVRRGNEPKLGFWSFPAGFLDAGETPENGAMRESLEETGLTVELDGLHCIVSGREHTHGADLVIVYRGHVVGGELVPGDDATEAGYFGINELPPLAFRATRVALGLDD
ncbi:MAG TPA: NUDIX domain-containing protein [Bellilinea sp.]|nr:NUDIX domain-containing protein [Bellilinea sp.]